MDDTELRLAGQKFAVGEDLYGVSVEQLRMRLDILTAEHARITRMIAQKSAELSAAENFFKKS